MTWRMPIAAQLIGSWINADCEVDRSHHERAGQLYDSWRAFAHARHAQPGSPAEFAEQMEARGFEVDRLCGERSRIRWGLRLRSPIEQSQWAGGGR